MGKSRQAKIAHRGEDQQLTIQEHSTDVPVLPIEHFERIHQIRPDLVDEIWQETKTEATHRRAIENGNAEHFRKTVTLSQWTTFTLVLVAIGAGTYISLNSSIWFGGAIVLLPLLGMIASYFKKK